MYKHRGFTLVELVVTIAIVGIIVALAVPSFRDMIERKRIGGAAEAVYEKLQYAKSQSIKRSTPIIVDIRADGTTTWAIGITDDADGTVGCNASHDAAGAAPCTLDYNNDGNNADALLMRIVSTDFSNIKMKGIASNNPIFDITSNAGDCTTTAITTDGCFEPIRGLARKTKSTDHIRLVSDSYTLQIEVDVVGKIKICVPPSKKDIVGYKGC